MKTFWNIFKWLLAIGGVLGLILLVALFVFVIRATKDLPSIEALAEYRPPVMSRVHAGDGKLISEFRTEARVFVPIETVPKQLQYAFVAAEDKRFYDHNGFDEKGFARAMIANIGHVLRKERLEGGSTLTQQVAKNFLVGNERNVTRKVREVVIAGRIEKALDKDHILELYLNDIYFGRGAYGVAAASLNYFGKPMKELSLDQIAYLAVLPKAPSNYQVGDPEKKARALNRRNYVLNRMVEDGYASQAASDTAKQTDILVTKRFEGDEYLAAEYFVEEARKQIYKLYGKDELYSGGLSIRTTLDTGLQLAARKALRDGLEGFDRRHGYRGPLGKFENFDDWKKRLSEFNTPKDIGDWRVGLVLNISDEEARIGFVDQETKAGDDADEKTVKVAKAAEKGTLNISDIQWAAKALAKGEVGRKPKKVTEVISQGDVILVQRKPKSKTEYNLRQIPKVNGGIIAMDPHTGRVLSLVGGYSFEQSQFNRVTQAKRQPGSAFKPFVYAAALDNGFTPSSQVLDAPFVIERQDIECEENEAGTLELRDVQEDGQIEIPPENTSELGEDEELAEEDECERFYKPSNYNTGKFYGLSTLRLGLEKSRNAMTVRLANDIGMTPVNEYGRRFGIYDETKPELAWALGAGETTLLRLASAYSTLVNGGKAVKPTILDRVQDGQGKTIFVHGDNVCEACQQDEYMAGKTGTTNESVDNWFMGFSPDLVAGVYVGMDNPEQMGKETGSSSAAPIFRDFMREALKAKPKVPFRIPEGVTLSPVNRDTGEPSFIGAPNFILEAFRPGTEPKIGALKSNIRVGSGSDSFGSYNYDFDDASNDNETLEDVIENEETSEVNEELIEEQVSSQTEQSLTETSESSETVQGDEKAIENEETREVATETVVPEEGVAEASDELSSGNNTSEPIETDIKQPVKKKDLALKDEAEEDLDDGLY